ncbi:hypothetical protein LTR35_014623 [Friedmanniomyces endolithicus]|uniref:Uncharacterized protein n=1 Tax=Friedmanniomyces endolithicus TaxID=329885 RepID=A0AAN6FDI0_9PEZI|nr:hypothetical protein LTR35_014623 [Friedmanniomyces endolithicus]KAK0275095.1 hypothetical protein LTS00_015153 [Friedmanniomyces endolithicus]KAK0315890.1 hypothetical protein LTR82_012426 [Friedmanniomyces endolithicus]KAK0979170.1 hypothetical protein LTR54_015674 [Friedmanniomyces endolithicus]
MRGRCVEQCDTNLATPGIPSDDCAERRSVYIDEAEEGECPLCVRKAMMSLRSGNRNAAPPAVRPTRPVRSTRTPSVVESVASREGFTDGSSVTTHNSMCPRGRCDMHDIPGRGMECLLCGRTIGCATTGSEADTLGSGSGDRESESPFADTSGYAYADGEDSYANHFDNPFRDPGEESTAVTSVHEGSGEEREGGRQRLLTVWEEGPGSDVVARDDDASTTLGELDGDGYGMAGDECSDGGEADASIVEELLRIAMVSLVCFERKGLFVSVGGWVAGYEYFYNAVS